MAAAAFGEPLSRGREAVRGEQAQADQQQGRGEPAKGPSQELVRAGWGNGEGASGHGHYLHPGGQHQILGRQELLERLGMALADDRDSARFMPVGALPTTPRGFRVLVGWQWSGQPGFAPHLVHPQATVDRAAVTTATSPGMGTEGHAGGLQFVPEYPMPSRHVWSVVGAGRGAMIHRDTVHPIRRSPGRYGGQ